jgi:16S rRNA (cytosine1402-N4)-methyltransferase
MDSYHIPVLLHEVLDALKITSGGRYIDCTFGGGGYSQAIVEHGGRVLGLDVDEDALSQFKASFSLENIILVQANFENVYDIAQQWGFLPSDGVVFDLGVSSYQLDVPEKGFSFQKDGPLDMRMDKGLGITAGKLLDVLDEKSLAALFVKFGDEMHAKKIARAIVSVKTTSSYWEHKSTLDLASLVAHAVGGRRERIHPATRVFQALRMAVNDEVGALHRGLAGAFESLGVSGRLAVVSFHSGEERIVKHFMSEHVALGRGKMVGDYVTAREDELVRNPRARSAKLRIFEKIA